MRQKSQKTKNGKVSNKVKKESIASRKKKLPTGRPKGQRVGTKKTSVTTSKKINPALLKGTKTKGNYISYDIPASKIYDDEAKRLAQLANSRLRALEKSGQSEYSREYQLVEHYAVGDPNGKGTIYNVNDETGTIRFKGTTRNITPEERSYYINTLRNFLNAKTSTVKGTREAARKSYDTFMKNRKDVDLTIEEYQMLWKTFRENVTADRASHEGYNAFMYLMENNKLYDLNEEQAAQAMQYINNSTRSSTIGIAFDVEEQMPFIRSGGHPIPNPYFK